MVNVHTTEADKSALYESIGRAVAAYSKLEHILIELALVWDDNRKIYGNSLENTRKYVLGRLTNDPDRSRTVRAALRGSEELTETRNAIVHGVWMEVHLDEEGRFFAVRTLPRRQARNLEHPEHLHGKAMSTADIKTFAESCERRGREIGAVRDSLHAAMRTEEGGRVPHS